MILFEKNVSYFNRLFTLLRVIIIIVIAMSLLFRAVTYKEHGWVAYWFYIIPVTIFLNSYFKCLKYSLHWISLIEIVEGNICHVVVKRKDKLEIDISVPISELKFELVPIPSRYTYYKLLVYYKSDLLVAQWELDEWRRYRMQKIIQYFHPDSRMAKQEKL